MLILERPWTRQPQGAVPVTLRTLRDGLCVLTLQSASRSNLIDGRSLPFGTTTAGGVGRYGKTWAFTAADTSKVQAVDYQPIKTSTGDGLGSFTILVIGNPTSSTNLNWLSSQRKSTGINLGQVNIVANMDSALAAVAGKLSFYTYHGTNSAVDTANTVVNGNYRCIVGRRDIGGSPKLSLWVDGNNASVNRVDDASVKNIVDATGGDFAIGGLANQAADLSGSCGIALVACWNRALLDAEIVSVSSNPWQLFAPRRIHIPTAAAAATAPTITALSAISITATSAQPQITYA